MCIRLAPIRWSLFAGTQEAVKWFLLHVLFCDVDKYQMGHLRIPEIRFRVSHILIVLC